MPRNRKAMKTLGFSTFSVRPTIGLKSTQGRPKWTQSWPKVGPKSAQGRPKVSPRSAQRRPMVLPKSAQGWPQVGSQKWPQVGSKSSRGRSKVGLTLTATSQHLEVLVGTQRQPSSRPAACRTLFHRTPPVWGFLSYQSVPRNILKCPLLHQPD